MKPSNVFRVLNAALLPARLAFPLHAQTIVQKTENFDFEASARANGWWEMSSRSSDQDFGFSAAGLNGAAGESRGASPLTAAAQEAQTISMALMLVDIPRALA